MSVAVQFITSREVFEEYRVALSAALAETGVEADLAMDHPPEAVDYIVYAPHEGAVDLSPYSRAKAALGLWAGVETIISNPTLTMPYARMVDPGLTEGMVEWVTGHVLRHHLEMDADICRSAPKWEKHVPPLARDRRVGVLGLGELGAAVARALAGLNFDVAGWSRRTKEIEGVSCHAGSGGLDAVLAQSEILVLLLPLTPATENILDSSALARLPEGAVIVNPGRGALVDDAALLAALDAGQVGHATLDTFRVEPLPEDHPFWHHPRVTVTPHIASETRAGTASRVIAENIRRGEAGERLLHLVDRAAGY
ncbi:glyoxylate/hydroxypyruvate reductase A [Maritimibacter sp. HL-12]|jgi:glyoxylate/hydroxypyruvate reductase|uniref:2-hydroxyacid dehydrogenase n=1 Tax=Maritimibacter sp. HL-12 TaxID=1162418 RepID=UPI000A0F05DA|nr:glyoxylate/hydroxypyruvate reductase A [Maritimibacter sp. HL-12]SMH50302.1 glyoxylate/hydroxypyruvate reductase A [Maritimibacter sp. HL-12]